MKYKIILLLFMVLLDLTMNAQIKKDQHWAWQHYYDENYAESFVEFKNLSQYMLPQELYALAQHYHFGLGTERSKGAALTYYKKAANLGDKDSQAEICEMLFRGDMEDEQEQYDLFKYSRMFCTNFEYSNVTSSTTDIASYAISQCYKNGWGTQINTTLADAWLAYAAYLDVSRAQREFNLLYNANNSEEDELTMSFIYFKHLYETIRPYLVNDHSIEASFFTINYLISCQTPEALVESLNQTISLYENPQVSNDGKACLHEMLMQFGEFNNEIKEKFADDGKLYELISDEDKATWLHTQLTKVMWKVDVMLNQNPTSGIEHGHKWVDLGLPSATKWACDNIGVETATSSGYIYAWAESEPKQAYTKETYSVDNNIVIMDKSNDTAKLLWGNNWGVPSYEDWNELFTYCDIRFENEVIVVSSPNGESISLPLTLNSSNGRAYYWANTCVPCLLRGFNDDAACVILTAQPDWDFQAVSRWQGCSIRPVLRDE